MILSIIHNVPAPSKNPIKGGDHFGSGPPSDNSIAGESNDQKLAAIITPAAKASIPFKTFLLISLKKITPDAPSAVTSQVKQPAKSA